METNIIYNEDCFETLKRLGNNSIDAIVTDPPYSIGFMGKNWDKTGIAERVDLWQECLRVLKPGGNLLSFGGTRTYHRMVCAIEDAGFEIKDCIMWVYGSGFPKSLNLGKAVDKKLGNEREIIGDNIRLGDKKIYPKNITNAMDYQLGADMGKVTKGTSEWEGYGTGLKPAYEPIVLAMKPLDGTFAENCLKWGVGGLNIDESRIETDWSDRPESWKKSGYGKKPTTSIFGSGGTGIDTTKARFPANFIHDGSQEVMELFPDRLSSGLYKKTGKQQKTTGSFIRNWERDYDDKNVFAGDSGSAARFFYCAKASRSERDMGLEDMPELLSNTHKGKYRICKNCGERAISGTYEQPQYRCQCQNPEWEIVEPDRERYIVKNNHPTVKPLALMEYLVKLVTRPQHIVFDPFIGSGTSAMACAKLDRHYIGCELDKDYYNIALKRIKAIEG